MFNFDNINCVVFDEIPYINDPDRGTVWEETIMLLGTLNKLRLDLFKNLESKTELIQLVMLSATIDEPENFAKWISEVTMLDTWISGFQKRVVPLKHYSLLVVNNKILKNK